ncbi:MAG: type III secretion system gatekeeper subunit SctW [Gammaproteobacteria bacterium]|nr:type III secretion system gatekeeper subunit SctW [Gammaproteobacteria bacterium]MDE0282981.1 type III secretion system gatekeeper subunit SctW [Gammaproteobacteria bacterium]MDE0510680.1 type III secretion system gatekeeper subunit SctW [Gammaproteobacteria bacterium]
MSANVNPALAGAQAGVRGAAGAAAEQAVSSEFQGQTVSLVPSPEAILADSLEELTFSFSEITQKKEITERNLRSGTKTLSAELARKYLEQVPDLDQGQLKEWAKDLRQEKRPIDVQTFLRRAEKHFDDPSHAFMALSFAVDLLEQEEPDSETLANARQARDIYYERHAEAIDAGVNISHEVVKPKYAELGKPGELRAAYRDVVLDYESVGAAYEKIIAGFPGKTVAEAISFLLASLSADIHASQRDSSRSAKLQGIVSDLYQVKQLNTLHKSCENLLQRCHKLFNSTAPAENGMADKMLAVAIELKDAEWQGDKVLDKALASVGIREAGPAIYFLQGFKEIARLMPMKVFDDKNQRERMLASVQQRIDQEIDREEAELE